MSKTPSYQTEIGQTIAALRSEHGLTQDELAEKIGTSQSAVARIEKGKQNISFELISKFSKVFGRQILSINDHTSQGFRIHGGKELSGTVTINTSKNASVALLCASLLNRGRTVIKHIARIEEVFRTIEVLESIGVKFNWLNNKKDLEIISPDDLNLSNLDIAAARRTRTILMFMGPLLHRATEFELPYAGGCSLGTRSVQPHLRALSAFGLNVDAVKKSGFYSASITEIPTKDKQIVLIERGDTVTENVLMAAALFPGKTTIIGASANYMVQDVCFFLQKLGVKISGIGSTTLVVEGVKEINKDIEYSPSEDPIEAMSFIAVALATHSEITINRAPIEFLQIELEILKTMNARIKVSEEYFANNGKTRLVNLTVKKSNLIAPQDKIHPMPFPGLNIDNLPFFSIIAATAEGRTMIHDWVFENRAVYSTELNKLNGRVELLDAHRIYIEGPTNWRAAELVAPPALRPSVVVLIAMLAAPGTSILRNIYSINRGYQDFSERLAALGADISPLAGI